MKVLSVIKKHKVRPKKKLGQNFLIDDNIRRKLCDAVGADRDDTVLEVGPGCGSLTSILSENVKRLIAVEKDETCIPVLEEEIGKNNPSFEIFNESILDFDFTRLELDKPLRIIGNLPYYITTKILFHLIENRSMIHSAVLTMQKEVADRIIAKPGNRSYGRLSVSLRYSSKVEKLFDIKPNCFYPAPEVTSSVLRFTFLDPLDSINEDLLYDVIRALFEQRRKSIVNPLTLVKLYKISKPEAKSILQDCGVDAKKRAEDLILDDFLAITKEIELRRNRLGD